MAFFALELLLEGAISLELSTNFSGSCGALHLNT